MVVQLSQAQRAIVLRWMDSAAIPGAAVAVLQRGRVTVEGFGLASLSDGIPVTPDSLFPLASVTKSFTATAVMQLVEEGRLDLDQPVVRYLPWFRVADEGAAERITVRMLLSHQSGLGRTLHLDPTAGALYGSRRELAEALVTAHLQTPPGTAFSYSNEGFSVAGCLVDLLGTRSFEEHLRSRILEPLGMTASTPDIREWHRSPHRAYGYALDASGQAQPVPDLPVAPASLPAGRLSSTAPDLARYLAHAMEQHGATAALSQGSIREMQRPSARFDDTGWGYGLGWFIQHGPAGKIVRHGGNQSGVATYLLMLPEHQLGVVVLTNLSAAPARQIAEELANVTLERPVLRSSQSEFLPVSSGYRAEPGPLADSAGSFTAGLGDVAVSVSETTGSLRLVQRLRATGAEAVMDTLPTGPDRFLVNRGGSEGMPVHFLRSELGVADRMLLAGTLYRRA